MRLCLLLLFLLWLAPGPAVCAETRQPALRIVVPTDVYNDYLRFLHNRNPLEVHNYGGAFARRDVIEVLLLQQALQHGGETRPVRFMLADSDSRLLKMLKTGQADISGSSQWKSDADEAGLAASHALVPVGSFEAGIYLPADHPARARLAREPEALPEFVAACAGSWHPDIATLQALHARVVLTENWESMLGMLQKKRADFVLAPFQPTSDFRLAAGGLTLLPVQGVKVSLMGSRHFLLNPSAGELAEMLKHLDAGIDVMERDGTLRRAYRESGFEDVRVKSWRRLNGDVVKAAPLPSA